MAGFKTRVLSAVVLVVVLGTALFFGGYYLWALMLGASLTGYFEFVRAMRDPADRADMKPDILELLGYAGVVAVYIVLLIVGPAHDLTLIYYTLIILLIALMIIYVLRFPKYPTSKMMQIFFGVIYVGVMLSFVYLTRIAVQGSKLIWLIFIASWICDTCAYLTGMALGRHKLAPELSPKKSVEGAIGGVVGAALVGFLYGLVINLGASAWMPAAVCGAGAVISQFGDLTASAIKRNHDIKDYGNLIPGHGGILDRFDSVIITAPIVFILSQIIIRG
ncbi:MAG: phosphatidate cytidylyltransferase [Lachnospiraceae bacterium]|nr:phosphatidate cytidylyltransferase [Lachnospiraceae bacterium]